MMEAGESGRPHKPSLSQLERVNSRNSLQLALYREVMVELLHESQPAGK